ncbi:hypothetical protein ACRALDRAFT_207491 [Sodiomyces alcalophilus JCM 7366]|uniref:uncharacterized protein n=1 Tax=Sodiomyces alcalophilus JCM 7366 TaxID=591952 RepID=UPI0039B3FBAD
MTSPVKCIRIFCYAVTKYSKISGPVNDESPSLISSPVHLSGIPCITLYCRSRGSGWYYPTAEVSIQTTGPAHMDKSRFSTCDFSEDLLDPPVICYESNDFKSTSSVSGTLLMMESDARHNKP